MSFDDLLRLRRIRRERISKREVQQALKRAERDLAAAGAMMAPG